MSFRPRTIFLAFVVALTLAGLDVYVAQNSSSPLPSVPSEKHVVINLGKSTLSALVADTELTRTRGLSGHVALKEDEGMLFVFEQSAKYPFWMKDMLFSLDMIWLDSDRRVVDITRDATPSSYPELFTPKENAQYVLEVLSGWSARHKISVGDSLSFPGETAR